MSAGGAFGARMGLGLGITAEELGDILDLREAAGAVFDLMFAEGDAAAVAADLDVGALPIIAMDYARSFSRLIKNRPAGQVEFEVAFGGGRFLLCLVRSGRRSAGLRRVGERGRTHQQQ